MTKKRAPRNRTLILSESERLQLRQRLLTLTAPVDPMDILDRTICQDIFALLDFLPAHCVDLLIIDPPYNLSRTFGHQHFRQKTDEDYLTWVKSWLTPLVRTLKPTASIYMCGDWRSSSVLYVAMREFFMIRNRITWEREKGRGAKSNWKSSSEDIWYATMSEDYTFNVEAVKLKRRVIAPYRDDSGQPRDWQQTDKGKFRLTYPSNFWTDITVPFWSMPENTDHPTQKPEKLIAKLILASSNPDDLIFDPFAGVGTTAVTARKLNRHFISIEQDETYCCLAEKRLALAESDSRIQGYENGVFHKRNTGI